MFPFCALFRTKNFDSSVVTPLSISGVLTWLYLQLLEDEKQLANVTEKILEGNHEQNCVETVRKYLEKNGADMGLPPLDIEEAVALYNAVFYSAAFDKSVLEWRKDEIQEIVKEILGKFAEQLKSDPIFVDLGNWGRNVAGNALMYRVSWWCVSSS